MLSRRAVSVDAVNSQNVFTSLENVKKYNTESEEKNHFYMLYIITLHILYRHLNNKIGDKLIQH